MIALELGNPLARLVKYRKIVKMEHFKLSVFKFLHLFPLNKFEITFFFVDLNVFALLNICINHMNNASPSRRLLPAGWGSDLN